MDLRPGQAPLLPTLPPPLGLGLPPHLGLGPHQAHQLGLPFQQPGELYYSAGGGGEEEDLLQISDLSSCILSSIRAAS